MTAPLPSYATKSDFAYGLVRDRILGHIYPPGSSVNQASLASELGISTTPLREALKRLMAEGLVELDAHKDARVSGLSAEQARDLFEMRLALDPLAVKLAAERRTAADIDHVHEAAEGFVVLPDQPNIVDLVAHRRLHRSLYLASHNELLIAALDSLWDIADRYRIVGLRNPRDLPERAKKAHEHAQLVEFVISGDGNAAARVMEEHIRTSLGAKAAQQLALDETDDLVRI